MLEQTQPLPDITLTVPAGSDAAPRSGTDSAAGDVRLPYAMPQAEYMYGCIATAIGMVLGYYDLNGYTVGGVKYYFSNLIPGTISVKSRGSDGGSIYDMSDPSVLAKFIASDGYVKRFYNTTAAQERAYTFVGGDPAKGIDMSQWNCLADYLGTGQYWRGNGDLSTSYYYGTLDYVANSTFTYAVTSDVSIPGKWHDFKYGLSLYVQSVGYLLDARQTRTVEIEDFSFEKFMKEIDAGRPVLVSISSGTSGHMVAAYGYNAATREIIFDDTYRTDCRMSWTGTYYYSGKNYTISAVSTLVLRTNSPLTRVETFYADDAVDSGSTMADRTIRNGGSANIMLVNSGGSALRTAVYNGGSMCLSSGGRAESTTVGNQGSVFVYSGGTASRSTVTGGDLYVSSGGTATFTTLSNGYLYVKPGGVASSNTVKGGYLRISSGAAAKYSTVNGGMVVVSSGGTAYYNTVNSGGYLYTYSGGTATLNTVNSGGCLRISSGGTGCSATVNYGGRMYVSGGATTYANTVNSSGFLYISSGGRQTGTLNLGIGAIVSAYTGSIIDFDLTSAAPGSTARINRLSQIYGVPTYTVTLSPRQTTGSYKLAGGAAEFTGSIAVNTTFGDALGAVSVGGKIDGGKYTYRLSRSAGTLTLTVDCTVSTFAAGDLNCDDRSDILMSIVQKTHPSCGATGAWLIQSDQTAAWGNLSQRNDGWEIFGTGYTAEGKSTADVYLKSTGNVVGAWITNASGKVSSWKTVGEFDADTRVLGLGDFSGNGQTDLLLRNTNGAVGCFFTGGTKTGWNYFQSLGDEWKISAVGDLNGDGRDDVVLKHDAGFAGSWLTQADGTMKWANLDTLAAGFSIVGAGDFDGDGTDDVLLKKGNYYGAWLVRNGGVKSWMGFGDLGNVTVEEIGDFDGDGRDDLRIRTAAGDLGAQLVKGADTLEWRYYGSVGSEWSTSLAAI